MKSSSQPRTQFTAWMQSNIDHPEHQHLLLYKDYPTRFVYNESKKTWKLREADKSANVVARLYEPSPSPKNRELFWLRMVLNHIPGATCFEDLRKVKGTVYQSYYDVLRQLGVIEDSDQWIRILS